MLHLSIFIENFIMAFASLRRHKLRSLLTVIGVIIGVITVMLVSSIISGIRITVEKQIESSGTNSIFVTTHDNVKKGSLTRERRVRKPLTLTDGESIRKLSAIQASLPIIDISISNQDKKIRVIGKQGKSSNSITVIGIHPTLDEAKTEILIEGRWFTHTENNLKKDVALINTTVAEDFFPDKPRIGQTLEIDGRRFRVIGVLEKRGQILTSSIEPRKIYIPINSALRINPNLEELYILTVAKPGQIELAKEQIEDLLRVRRKVRYEKPNNFRLSTARGRIQQFNSVTFGIFILMIAVSSIALLISGIGVMNIMLVSVTERTMEIGIRKTVGARQSDILTQFLTEAVTLTGIGGSVGLIIGWLLVFCLSLVFPSSLPWWAPVTGLLVSVGIGVFFGLFPAYKAAKLDPIEALRFE